MKSSDDNIDNDCHEENAVKAASDGEKLRSLARCIRDGVAYVRKHAAAAVNAACTIGENLLAARPFVQHGEWEKWVVENTELSPRTARAYMELTQRLANLPVEERQRVAELPVRHAIKAITAPKFDTRSGSTAGSEDAVAVDSRQGCSDRLKAVREAIAALEQLASALVDGDTEGSQDLRALSQKIRRVLRLVC